MIIIANDLVLIFYSHNQNLCSSVNLLTKHLFNLSIHSTQNYLHYFSRSMYPFTKINFLNIIEPVSSVTDTLAISMNFLNEKNINLNEMRNNAIHKPFNELNLDN